jgi:hypothetical protein
MGLEGQNPACRDIPQGLIKIGFRPRQIVDLLLCRALGDSLIDELASRMFDRCEVTARDRASIQARCLGVRVMAMAARVSWNAKW